MGSDAIVIKAIKDVRFQNFKSLFDFYLPLSHFTCLIGLNGVGKSTVLQAFDFLSQLMKGALDDWLAVRGWLSKELKSSLPERQGKTIFFSVSFAVDLEMDSTQTLCWSGSFSQRLMRCKAEKVELKTENDSNILLHVADNRFSLRGERQQDISFKYCGSILSQLEDDFLEKNGVPELSTLRSYVRDIKSLELLSPHPLKANSRGTRRDIGLGGERFPSFLETILNEGQKKLLEKLQEFYPQITSLDVRRGKFGVRSLDFMEDCGENDKIVHGARHINDGTLRMLAILSQTLASGTLLLFDEIENGINPALMEKLVRCLLESDRQILVTTHNPIVLNFLPEEAAKESVFLIYKQHGKTLALPFFQCPETLAKLDLLGPGEVYLDTDVRELTESLLSEESPR